MNDKDAKKYEEFATKQTKTINQEFAKNKDANPPNPKQRHGDMKAALHLVPPALMIGAARAFKEGAQKYGAYNWRESKVEIMTYLGAIQRHAAAILDGEDADPESPDKLHVDGIAACAAIILDAYHGGFLIDNRPPKGPAPELLRLPKENEATSCTTCKGLGKVFDSPDEYRDCPNCKSKLVQRLRGPDWGQWAKGRG